MDTTEPTILFRAVLHPNRSLSPAGFRLLMGGLAGLSLCLGLGFWLSGAWPVVGLLGFDILLLWLAFRASYRAGRVYETVELTERQLTVRRVEPAGPENIFTFQPHWLRVTLDEPVRHDSHLHLSSHGRTIIVGSFLAPEERADFARALRAALDRLRRPPSPAPA